MKIRIAKMDDNKIALHDLLEQGYSLLKLGMLDPHKLMKIHPKILFYVIMFYTLPAIYWFVFNIYLMFGENDVKQQALNMLGLVSALQV